MRDAPAAEVRIVSQRTVEIVFEDAPGGIPNWRPRELPLLRMDAGGSAVEVAVLDGHGARVSYGFGQRSGDPSGDAGVVTVTLDREIPPSVTPYTVTAHSNEEPKWSASANYFVADVPPNVAARVGDAYVETALTPSILWDARRSSKATLQPPTVLRSRRTAREIPAVAAYQGIFGLFPAVRNADTLRLQREYGHRGSIVNGEFTCFNLEGERAQAQLRRGARVRVDTIVLAAHEVSRLSNGEYVDSPLIVGFAVHASDLRIIEPLAVTVTSPFHGNCSRGFVVLRDAAHFRKRFRLSG